MKQKTIILITFLVIGIFSSNVFGQAFADKGFYPRISSLGRSASAMKGDIGAVFYNPASIASINTVQIFTSFTNLYPNISDDKLNSIHGGASYFINNIGAVGISFAQFSPNYWTEQSFIGSFGTEKLYENLSLGTSFKILRWSAESPSGENAVPEDPLSFTGISFDAGLIYLIPEIAEMNDLQIGLSLMDINQPSIAKNKNSDAALPMQISLGAAYISRQYNYTMYSSATLKQKDIRVSFGYEISALKTAAYNIGAEFIVRIGAGKIVSSDSQGEYNGGFGIAIEKLRFDYSYSYQAFIRNIGGISSLALHYEF